MNESRRLIGTKVEAAVGAAFKSVNQELDDTFKTQLQKIR